MKASTQQAFKNTATPSEHHLRPSCLHRYLWNLLAPTSSGDWCIIVILLDWSIVEQKWLYTKMKPESS